MNLIYITVNESDSLSLHCMVGGAPEAEVDWRKHGADIPFVRASMSNGNQVLTIASAVPEDSGGYQCSSINSVGNLSHVFEVTVSRT